MAVNIQTDTSLVNNYADSQNAFNTAASNTNKFLTDIQSGREKATVNKLYGESLNPDGTLDTNKLTQGMASTGLGAKIPELLQQKQEQELNTLKLGKAKVDQSLSHLGIIGQVMGSVTNKDEYNKGLSVLQEQGIDVSKYPQVNTDEEAKKNASFASNNAISASDKVSNDYKSSELFTRLQKYQTELETANKKQEWEQSKFKTTSDETARHNQATEQYQQQQIDNKSIKPLPLSEGEKVTQKEEAKYNVALDIESGKNKQLKENLHRTIDVNGKPVNRLEHLIDTSLGSATEAGFKNKLGSLTGISTEAATATSELEMEGAKILSTIPYPPGAQSEKELEARRQQVGDIANPATPIETRKALLKDLINYADTFEQTHPKKLGSGSTSSSNVSSKPTIQSLVDKLPSGVSEADKAEYIDHLKAKGLQ